MELRWKYLEIRDAGLVLGVRIDPWTQFLEARSVASTSGRHTQLARLMGKENASVFPITGKN